MLIYIKITKFMKLNKVEKKLEKKINFQNSSYLNAQNFFVSTCKQIISSEPMEFS